MNAKQAAPKRRRPRKAIRAERGSYSPPVLNEEQQARKKRLLSHFRQFAKMWQGTFYHPIPHDEMCDELHEAIPNIGTGETQTKKAYLAPRYTYKTNLVQALIVYVILLYRELGIDASCDYMRAVAEDAEGFLYEIKQRLQTDEQILELWGDLSKEAHLWSARRINLGTRRDPTIAVLGLDKGTAGKHPDFVICDDLVNEKNYDSVKARRAARNKVQSYYAVLPPHGSLLLVGTRFANNDVYGWVMDQNEATRRRYVALIEAGKREEAKLVKPQWTFYIRSVRDAKGNLFFPDKLGEAFLAQQKESLEAKWYAAWYENRPDVEGMQRFRLEYLKYFSARYSHTPYPTLQIVRDTAAGSFPIAEFPVRVTMTIDPTLTANKTSDWTGITLVACDAADNWWVLASRRYLEVPSVISDKAVEDIRRYRPSVCRIESAAADADMVARIQRAISEENIPTSISSYHPVRDEDHGKEGVGRRRKQARIEALEPRFRNGQIFLHRNTCEALYEQYKNWPDVDHDDVFDSLAMHHGLAKPCAFRTLEDLRRAELDELDPEQPGGDRSYETTVRMVGGGTMKLGVPVGTRAEPGKLVGWAGISSQRLKTSA